MKYVIYFISIILLLGLNVGFFPFFKINGVTPNLLFLLVVILALDKQNFDFIFVALVSGLYLDFYNSALPGTFAVPLVLVGILINLTVRNILVFEINWKYLSLILVVSEVLFSLFLWGISKGVYKLSWSSFFVDFNVLKQREIAQIFYDLLLLYPSFILAIFVRNYITGMTQKRRHIA